MAFLRPAPPPIDPLAWLAMPAEDRAKLACQAWGVQGYGTPFVIFCLYGLKVCFYVGMWALWCSLSPSLGTIATIGHWWLKPLAFQKAIVWSLLFEILGLGCGFGPLCGRYLPPVGGFLYFLRPGTIKLPLFPGAPVIGKPYRSLLDVVLYAAVLVSAVRALIAPDLSFTHLLPIVILMPLLGVVDKTLFLAARSEHYWVAITVFAFASPWLAGAKIIQLALWLWAGISKLNHHFPTVVCAMVSNSPYMRFRWLLERMYRDYPNDMRPSLMATSIAHFGTALEFAVPIAFLLTPLGEQPVLAIGLMLALHVFITSNFPMGVPLEWNVAVMYSGFALFWAHPDVSVLEIQPWYIVVFLAVMLIGLPTFGNFVPRKLSFLLSMRYYAGNWPCSMWLCRAEALAKIAAVPGAPPMIHDQLGKIFEPMAVLTHLLRGSAFRLMHLQGRVMTALLPKYAPDPNEYATVDGELIAGMALGWSFGDAHLHDEQLMKTLQGRCQFGPGDVIMITVESQPVGQKTFAYRVVDAARGLLEAGEMPISELRQRQPWTMGR